jgi:phosphatidylglycerophosphatase A
VSAPNRLGREPFGRSEKESAIGAPAATGASAQAPRRPTLRFMLSSPWHLIAIGAGSGLPRFAPGTWGTLLAWLLYLRLDRSLDTASWWLLVALMLVVGAVAADITGRRLGVPDSGHIVIDEIVAFWIVLLMLPGDSAHGGAWLIAAFALFRFFDIVKPPPIRVLDARFKNGVGVMADDLVAAFYTLLALAVGVRLFG